jgi:methylenetetrahydrofolate reductase (NADPH)
MQQADLAGSKLSEAVVSFLRKFTIESTPKEGDRIANFGEYLDKGRWIYIAHVGGTPYTEQISMAKRLKGEGFEPVLHITARDLTSEAMLDDILTRYAGEAGGTNILLIAGDLPKPAGEFDNTVKVLRTGLLERHGIKRLGLAGHPEGNKNIPEEAARAALKAKNEYARETDIELRLVTQFGFEAEPYIAWERQIREEGLNSLKIYAGVPGLASFTTLLRFAAECGVGASMRALRSRAGSLAKLATVAEPDELVTGLAKHQQDNPDTLIEAPHFFPFGGLKKTANWLNAIFSNGVEMNASGQGFRARS